VQPHPAVGDLNYRITFDDAVPAESHGSISTSLIEEGTKSLSKSNSAQISNGNCGPECNGTPNTTELGTKLAVRPALKTFESNRYIVLSHVDSDNFSTYGRLGSDVHGVGLNSREHGSDCDSCSDAVTTDSEADDVFIKGESSSRSMSPFRPARPRSLSGTSSVTSGLEQTDLSPQSAFLNHVRELEVTMGLESSEVAVADVREHVEDEINEGIRGITDMCLKRGEEGRGEEIRADTCTRDSVSEAENEEGGGLAALQDGGGDSEAGERAMDDQPDGHSDIHKDKEECQQVPAATNLRCSLMLGHAELHMKMICCPLDQRVHACLGEGDARDEHSLAAHEASVPQPLQVRVRAW